MNTSGHTLVHGLVFELPLKVLLQELILIVTDIQNTVEFFLDLAVSLQSLVDDLHLIVYPINVVVFRSVGLLSAVCYNRVSQVRIAFPLRHLPHLHPRFLNNAVQLEILSTLTVPALVQN